MAELADSGKLPTTTEGLMLQGGYPALYQRQMDVADWMANYITTYVERDVRQLINVRDLGQFQRFVKMCAARSAQLLNLSTLAADCGITHNTARQWISVLEASYLVRLVQPYHENFGKRLVKTPKLYFLDVGLMAYLLGVRDKATLQTHAARGALFETAMVSECIKHQFNQGRVAELYFWRDATGHEVDLLLPQQDANGSFLRAVEIKSGTTFATDWLDALRKFSKLQPEQDAHPERKPWLVHGGKNSLDHEVARLVSWKDLSRQLAGDSACNPAL
jgi:predicted AAA+ superfamily ATPase